MFWKRKKQSIEIYSDLQTIIGKYIYNSKRNNFIQTIWIGGDWPYIKLFIDDWQMVSDHAIKKEYLELTKSLKNNYISRRQIFKIMSNGNYKLLKILFIYRNGDIFRNNRSKI